jgi:LPXTG-motif cell wall-anchored protein
MSVVTDQSGQDEDLNAIKKKALNTGRDIGIGVGVGGAALLGVVAVVLLRKKRKQSKVETEDERSESIEKAEDAKGAGTVYAVAEMQHQEPVRSFETLMWRWELTPS